MKRLALLATCALAAASCQAPDSFDLEGPPQAGVTGQELERIIVVFEPGTSNGRALASQMSGAYGRAPTFVYETALRGFSAVLPRGASAALARHPAVAYVEPDFERSIAAQSVPTGISRMFSDPSVGDGSDERVDVDVAIIDTGIDFEHPDLNVVGGVNCATGGPRGGACEPGGDDDHYHGTHVGGTVAALDNGVGVVGVAPGARLWAVKVLNKRGSGYTSWIIAGIDWVAANAATIEVANMSLGGSGYSQAEYDAIQGAVEAGVAFAVAAGNSNANANNYSPAAFGNVLTVSALADFDGMAGGSGSATCRSDEDDTLADFSNWGSAVDIAAPGVCIQSTFPIEQGSYGTISGTSMASPHAAGALALLASNNPPASEADVMSLYGRLIADGNSGWTDDSGDGIKEPLLDVSAFSPPTLVDGGAGSGGGNASPSASIVSADCTDLTCTFTGSGNDSDGDIVGYSWDFGDGNNSTDQDPSHAYASSGSYTVTLTVTDNEGATGSASRNVTPVDPNGAAFSYTLSRHKRRGENGVGVSWTGAPEVRISIDELSKPAEFTPEQGYIFWTGNKGGATYTVRVCPAAEGSTLAACSTSTVVF